MNLREIGVSDSFARTVALCGSATDRTQLDRDIVTLWEGMLNDVHPELYGTYRPDSASWHREFIAAVDGDSAGAVNLFPLACVIAEKIKLAYPAYDSVDRQYIDGQKVSSETRQLLHYDRIFDHAVENVAAIWRLVERAVCDENVPNLPVFGDWNLDTGLDELGRLVFWD